MRGIIPICGIRGGWITNPDITPPRTDTQVKLFPNRVSITRFEIGLQVLACRCYHCWGGPSYHQVRLSLRRRGGESWGISGREKVSGKLYHTGRLCCIISWVFITR